MRGITKKDTFIPVIMYYPKTKEDQHRLQEKTACVHAELVNQQIQKLNCPSKQKLQLFDAVIQSLSCPSDS